MIHPRERPKVLPNKTYKFEMGCGKSLFITITKNSGNCSYPFEIFIVMGKSGDCHRSLVEGLGRAVSLYLRAGGDAADIAKSLRHIRCPYPSVRPDEPKSCADAIAIVIEKELNMPEEVEIEAESEA